MPSLGADMEAGTLVEWLKHPGDAVKRGDIIAVVDTQKGAIEIEVFEDGTIESVRIKPGEKVPVGTVLALDPRRRRGSATRRGRRRSCPGTGSRSSASIGRGTAAADRSSRGIQAIAHFSHGAETCRRSWCRRDANRRHRLTGGDYA